MPHWSTAGNHHHNGGDDDDGRPGHDDDTRRFNVNLIDNDTPDDGYGPDHVEHLYDARPVPDDDDIDHLPVHVLDDPTNDHSV